MVRRDAAGKVLWTAALSGNFAMHREPHLLADAARVYVSHDDGITSRSVADGSGWPCTNASVSVASTNSFSASVRKPA